MLRFVHSRAAEGDAGLRRDACHFGHDESRPAEGPCSQVHQMKIGGSSIDGAVHIHGRDDYTIDDGYLAQRERREHRWDGSLRRFARGATGEPAFQLVDILLVADPKIFVAYSLTTRQQTIRELFRIEIYVPTNILKPFHRIPRGTLQAKSFGLALAFILLECCCNRLLRIQCA